MVSDEAMRLGLLCIFFSTCLLSNEFTVSLVVFLRCVSVHCLFFLVILIDQWLASKRVMSTRSY